MYIDAALSFVNDEIREELRLAYLELHSANTVGELKDAMIASMSLIDVIAGDELKRIFGQYSRRNLFAVV